MAKIQHDIPEDLHFKVRELQLRREMRGKKASLKDTYIELMRRGLEVIEREEK